ncbi:MAG: hypothetical protein HQL41_18790, partial [Alphaproteobacteria bacterium]|nr:hypothetical protein [Alphaproteobacteria bacterium]
MVVVLPVGHRVREYRASGIGERGGGFGDGVAVNAKPAASRAWPTAIIIDEAGERMPRFVVVIVGAFIAAVTVFAVLEMVIARKAQESGNVESARRVLASALELGRHTIAQDAGTLAAAAHGVMNEPGARDAFVRRDIDALATRIGPVFERLKAMRQVSALSARAADGTILFRAHAPGQRGGGPLHASYWRASESRMPAAGLEITEGGAGVGVSVVSPWLDDQGTL